VRKENKGRVGIVHRHHLIEKRREVHPRWRRMGNPGSHGLKIISRRWIEIRMEN